MLNYLQNFNVFCWGGPMLVILLSVHIYLTIKSSFIQRHVFKGIAISMGHGNGFKVLSTTLAATLGTGNIIGVSTAVALGGPGALFWCLITGIFGMATTYHECYFATKYKTEEGGGAMYILMNRLSKNKTAYFYAFFLILICLSTGCLTQSNAVADSFDTVFNVHPVVTGLFVSGISGIVIIGGVNRIMDFCEKIVPVLCIIFIACLFWLLLLNSKFLPAAISLVFKCAFTFESAGGGFAGSGIILAARYGIARGLFTNEAGLGSAGVFAGKSNLTAHEQGLVSMSATFWDTVVICTLTGLAIISNYLAHPSSVNGYSEGGYLAAAFTQIPYIGNTLLCLSITGFALSTIIGWFFIGEQAVTFIFKENKTRVLPYIKALYVFMVFAGCNFPLNTIWEIADTFNIFLIIPNVYVLLKLTGNTNPQAHD